MSRAVVAGSESVADRYLELIREFPLRPIRSKADYRRAGKILDRLAVQQEGSFAPGEQDYLDTLSLLVEEYDREHRPTGSRAADAIKVLKHLMEETGMTVTDLGEPFGSKSVASEVLHGKRSLSKANIVKLAERFNLDAGVFLPPAK